MPAPYHSPEVEARINKPRPPGRKGVPWYRQLAEEEGMLPKCYEGNRSRRSCDMTERPEDEDQRQRMIEAEARRLYAEDGIAEGLAQIPWSSAPEFSRNKYRELAAHNIPLPKP
jgi:hypothetical protein